MDVDRVAPRITEALVARHPLFAPQTVDRLVRRTFAEFDGARVTTFLPILVRRVVESRLRDLDHDFRRPPRQVPAPCAQEVRRAAELPTG